MSPNNPDFFDTDGRPAPAAAPSPNADRKLRVWAVLNAIDQGLMSTEEAQAAYGLSAAELEEYRAGWLDFEAGRR